MRPRNRAASPATFVLLTDSGRLLLAADEEPKVVGAEESLAPADHAHGEEGEAGSAANLLQRGHSVDTWLFALGERDAGKREDALRKWVRYSLKSQPGSKLTFDELLGQIMKARTKDPNLMKCYCGRELHREGYCNLCTPGGQSNP